MTLYLEITKDEFELPLAVADSINELARLTGKNPANICHCIHREGRSKYIRVEVEDDRDVTE